MNANQIQRDRAKINSFLTARGAEALPATNEWELIRFKAGDETGVVYHKKSGQLTFVGPAKPALDAYYKNGPWRAVPATKRKSKPVVAAIIDRDGNLCFLCRKPFSDDDRPTRDHLVPLASKGPDHIANIVLMHQRCNSLCGHKSAMEKIAMREQYREHVK